MKKMILIISILLISLVFLPGAVTKNSLTPSTFGFAVNATSSDASECEELLAAVSGKAHYLTQAAISCGSDITVTIGAGEDANNVKTVLLGPVVFKAAGSNFASWTFEPALKIADANSITFDAGGAGNIQIFIEGYTK